MKEPFLRARWMAELALAVLVFLILVLLFLSMRDAPLLFDESAHFCGILSLLGRGSFGSCRIVTAPGYHAMVAALLRIGGAGNVTSARTVSFILGLFAIIPISLVARFTDRATALLRTLEVVTLPILLPYFPLLYTDVVGLGLLLLSVWAAMRRWPLRSALFLTAAILVRQNAIVWLPLVVAVCFDRSRGGLHLRHMLPFLLPVLLFGGLLWWNGGLSLNHAASTPAITFSLGNVFFALFLVTALFLPLVVGQASRIAALFGSRGNKDVPAPARTMSGSDGDRLYNASIWPLLGVFLFAFFLGFHVTHPVNLTGGQLRDAILRAVADGWFPRVLFLLATGCGLLTLIVTPFSKSASRLIFSLCSFASLASLWLIEPRYALPALVLFLLLRKPLPWKVEVAQVVFNLLLCLWIFL